MQLTIKQIALLGVIARGDGKGKPLDLDEILDKLDYETTKQSLQFSIRALMNKTLIMKMGLQKRRGRQRQVIDATVLGRQIAGVERPADPKFVVDELTDELDGVIDELEEISKF